LFNPLGAKSKEKTLDGRACCVQAPSPGGWPRLSQKLQEAGIVAELRDREGEEALVMQVKKIFSYTTKKHAQML
jgi:hypothetical protein